ncbi:MAG: ABC transporter permease [Pedobacter sp.]|nr:MAG: ABC transporter permease [Pedobacter sp.]
MARELKKYNHLKATLAIAKASLRSISRSPSAVVFTLAFPLIFILVFGFIGGGGMKISISVDPKSDIQNPIITSLKKSEVVRTVPYTDAIDVQKKLEKGNIDALLRVEVNTDSMPKYIAHVQYTTASLDYGQVLKSLLNELSYSLNSDTQKAQVMEIRGTTVKGREYRTIDFILPGQLGFSLLSTGVFGTAFVFFSLRQNLVIKRFFATPVRRSSIILGEAIARIGFALSGALFIILIGHYLFNFTLVNGAITVLNMLFLAFLGLIVFMGFGFVVSGLAKSESTIPPISNIITLPQFLLSGTFFSIEAFPKWLQPISKALPLTYLNDAMRKIAFEGAALWDVRMQIGIILLWGILIYAIAVKTFKWE